MRDILRESMRDPAARSTGTAASIIEVPSAAPGSRRRRGARPVGVAAPRRLAIPAILAAALPLSLLAPRGASAQGAPPSCRVLCTPSLTLMPGAIRTHLNGGPTVRASATGAESRLPSTWSFEMIVVAAARTAVPRTSLFGSVQWLPNATEARNPFTLYTASELGAPVHANAPTVTAGASFALLTPDEGRGWFDVAFNVGDLFSQAARPDDKRSYTHKLDLDLVGHGHAFAWAPAHSYLHRVSVYGILDYVATGLPKAGDEVPVGRTFMDDARPLSLIVGLALPISPAAGQ